MKALQTVPKFNRDLGQCRAFVKEGGNLFIERWNERLGEWQTAFMGGELDAKRIETASTVCVNIGTGLALENIQELLTEAKRK